MVYRPKFLVRHHLDSLIATEKLRTQSISCATGSKARSESTRQLNEAKILIVGQADVGKTSLVKRLVYGTFEPNEPQTEGIIIAKWQVPGIGGEQIRLNVWDFGGQEIMHATHQFFLTKRSLYLIVLDARKGENESNLNYWLNIVQSYGGDAPIILVTNKCEPPHHLDLNENRLTKDYSPNLKGFAKVSCKTGEGIETLQTEIAEQIRSLPHVSDLLPESYFRVKDHLATQRKDFIDYREYKKLCCKKGRRSPSWCAGRGVGRPILRYATAATYQTCAPTGDRLPKKVSQTKSTNKS